MKFPYIIPKIYYNNTCEFCVIVVKFTYRNHDQKWFNETSHIFQWITLCLYEVSTIAMHCSLRK